MTRASNVSLATLLVLLSGLSAAGCGGSGGSTPVIRSIAVSPAPPRLLAGGTLQLVATATWSDGKTTDVTSTVAWTSSEPVVTVSSSGLAATAAATPLGTPSTVTATQAGTAGTGALQVARAPAIGVALSNDPLSASEWYLDNTGQKAYADAVGLAGMDLRVSNAYSLGISGAGVKVAVLDTGLQIGHEDLAANVVPGSWNFVNDTADPTPPADQVGGDHGTSVSGIVAMVYGNSLGGMGVASRASLNGYNILGKQTQVNYLKAMGASSASPASSDVWVFNESYGTDSLSPAPVNPAIEAQYLAGVTDLRGGKGALYVKSAGNGFLDFKDDNDVPADCVAAKALGVTCQNANMEGENALPYVIVVGATNALGLRSSYSTAGSALWVSAPGGEYGRNASTFGTGYPAFVYQPAMVTTDLMGCTSGYARSDSDWSPFNKGQVDNASCNYANTFNGTSSAAPSTTGSIALLLEARPALTWREVKHILASTARRVDPAIQAVTVPLTGGTYVAEQAWTANRAGFYFHDWYGFGAVDVDAAVEMARTFVAGSLGAFQQIAWVASAPLSLAIPDASAVGVTSTLTVPATPANLTIEAVQIQFTASHPAPGNLGILLQSPSGTTSILLNIRNGFAPATGATQMVLLSNAFYGESAAGVWTLKVVDGLAQDVGTFDSWKIRVFGH